MDTKDFFVSIVFLALFYAIYQLIRVLTDYFLKRSIIKSGHYEKAEILSQGLVVTAEAGTNTEPNKYPSLKWGLVAFMSGSGLVLIDSFNWNHFGMNNVISLLSIGIELMFISAGFLLYFFIASYKSKTK